MTGGVLSIANVPGGGCGAIKNSSASGGGVQHVPATASGRRRLDYVNQWGQGETGAGR